MKRCTLAAALLTTSMMGCLVGSSGSEAGLDMGGPPALNLAESDLVLLPQQGCKPVTFDNPAEDLGQQLAGPLGKFRCVAVTLKEDTQWTWNSVVTLLPHQVLEVVGGGSDGFGKNPKVTINMTRNADDWSGRDNRRSAARLVAQTGSSFALRGVKVIEAAMDTRKLSWSPRGGALFVADGVYVTLTLEDISITTSEDVVSAGDRSFANVRFGHTSIDKAAGAPRDIKAVKIYGGGAFGSTFLFVHNPSAYTKLGAGVSFMTDPAIHYNDVSSYQEGTK